MTVDGVHDLAVRGCAALSSDAGEPLAGTAPAMRRVVAVEHVGVWPPRVAAHPDEAIAGLAERLRHQGVTLLLIRRPGRRGRETDDERAVFVADLTPGRSRVVASTVRGPADLDTVSFDLSAGEPVLDPLLLVCAHGRRDVCCAVRGRALAAAVAAAEPSGGVWECTHLGGHRFAPTALVLPTGYAYGRLDAATAVDARKAAGLGEVEVKDCRGHVGLEPIAQVAEIAVREHTGSRDAAGLVVDAVDGAGVVEVRDPDGRRWAVDVRLDTGTGARPPSCGAALEPVTPLVAGPPQQIS
ncbi:sucrase ferredoxin [Pseudonocardia sp. KRD291]|uniref:sucrase ferredoxin n=1 Tax=Pseudonocardia sp. KRD291 TaxID=2792007 RepID=UPI001C4A231B|nr:sucrase ferredoxin [Pseudonocardia sp. KRD291]MBW0103702.1 sucrase ferredoxin [Pseudonocardia sp. KRD291]